MQKGLIFSMIEMLSILTFAPHFFRDEQEKAGKEIT